MVATGPSIGTQRRKASPGAAGQERHFRSCRDMTFKGGEGSHQREQWPRSGNVDVCRFEWFSVDDGGGFGGGGGIRKMELDHQVKVCGSRQQARGATGRRASKLG